MPENEKWKTINANKVFSIQDYKCNGIVFLFPIIFPVFLHL